MNTTVIKFNGESYTCRIIADVDGTELVIAGTSLLDALHPGAYGSDNDGFASEEAQNIDESIFYYVSDVDLELPDAQLVEVLKDGNPECF